MTASPPEPRHRAVEVIERHLRDEDVYDAAGLAPGIVARLEAAGLAITAAPTPAPKGWCEIHERPQPCHGCAADAKAGSNA